jgi:CRP-like cAMP-binding protein
MANHWINKHWLSQYTLNLVKQILIINDPASIIFTRRQGTRKHGLAPGRIVLSRYRSGFSSWFCTGFINFGDHQQPMSDLFFEAFNKKVQLDPTEQEQIRKHLIPKRLRKKQYLLQEGEICRATAFVDQGCLRAYSVDENGSEHIIQFALEGWTIADLYSFLTAERATYNIDALENSELLLLSRSSHDQLLAEMPKYETYTRLNITGAYLAMQKRLTSIIGSSVEERYAAFTGLYPNIVQRVPQHMIASYMGLTPETLSRVRRRISSNK